LKNLNQFIIIIRILDLYYNTIMFSKKIINDITDDDILDKTSHLKNEYLINPNEWTLLFDGCSKGNPGQAGCGAVIYKNNTEVWSSSKYLGKKTNNQAEYFGLIMGLQQCINLKLCSVKVQGDSLLIINQMNLKYMVNSPLLVSLHQTASSLSSRIPIIQYEHIYRSENKRADQLANLALKNKEVQIDNINALEEPKLKKQTSIKDSISKMFSKSNKY